MADLEIRAKESIMIDRKRIAVNRIISPSLPLAGFYDFVAGAGFTKVELRNDIGGVDPIDGMKLSDAAKLAKDKGIEVITINALQKFNLSSARAKATAELDSMLAMARAIGCKAIVLCPNNEANDSRSKDQRLAETIEALKAFGPRFEKAGILGYVEPLGFGISSLASFVVAQEAIKKSGFSCYRVVHDTFHHHIGPDDLTILGKAYDVANTGLVHISGVETDIAPSEYRDAHRVLVGPADRMKSKEQMLRLDALGYKGIFSFEPFSPEIQKLTVAELGAALKKSLDYLMAI
jgi:2-keto-myo-inositol isomerase